MADGAAVSVATLLGGCKQADDSAAFAPWNGPAYDPDVRVRLIGWASLAPSFRNAQPWSVALDADGDSLRLYVDSRRLHPAADPRLRMAALGHGAFLELLAIAAPAEGRRAFITLLPEGPFETAADLAHKPSALVRLSRAGVGAPDPLFAFLRRRASSRAAFAPRAIPGAVGAHILAQARLTGGAGVGWADRGAAMERVRALCGEALRRELSSPQMMAETAADLRLTPAEVAERRDGVAPAPYRVGEAIRFLYGRRAFANPDSFLVLSGAFRAARWVETAAAFTWVITEGDGCERRIVAGRALARLDLAAAEKGVAIQPFSAPTCAAPAMDDLRAEAQAALASPGQTVQIIARLGYADAPAHAPRRGAWDFLASAR